MERIAKRILINAALVIVLASWAAAQLIPNSGQRITPTAPAGARFEPLNPGFPDHPQYLAGQAVTSLVSPDHKTLLVLTSGYNLLQTESDEPIPDESTQFVFVYDITQNYPMKKQVIRVPNSYSGIAFGPAGDEFFVSGGVDDNLHIYSKANGDTWAEERNSPIPLGHDGVGVGIGVKPQAAGVAVSADGKTCVVANYYNDSVSVLIKTDAGWSGRAELDLRPGKTDPKKRGVPGGEYPLWVAIKGNETAYVSSLRDREIVVVDISQAPAVTARIPVPGQPNRMVLNRSQSRLYVAQDNSDSVGLIDTGTGKLVANIPVTAPVGLLPAWKLKFKGNDTNSVTLATDEKRLYVTNGWMNNVGVIQLGATPSESRVLGLIPTGWYPNSVSLSGDGRYMYVVNGKSPTGPNPHNCKGLKPDSKERCRGANEYTLQLLKAGLQSFPVPSREALQALTQQVAANNHFRSRISQQDAAKIAFLRAHIKHVIYIIKENRTYDQVLGDLDVGNGDPNLTEFPASVTPNQHNLAKNFVTLDNFYCTSEVSFDGWSWSTSGRSPDVVEKEVTIDYAGRGTEYESEGLNRQMNVGLGTLAERKEANPMTPDDPDDLPGTANVAAPDGDDGEKGTGFLWNGALRAGRSVRNYGFFVDLSLYSPPAKYAERRIPVLIDPASTHTQVAFPANASLGKYTDIYFRGFDNELPDFYRVKEWEREFDSKYGSGGLPNLSLMRLMHDHTGSFGEAIMGVNTPEIQVADNDYAVGLVAQKVAGSRYKDSTLIFVIEDDAQDGGDHVDAHRSIAFVIGPYVKHKAVVSTSYTTLSMLRTMEEILGIGSMNLNDASSNVMADVFDINQKEWNYTAVPSDLLAGTQLPIPKSSGQRVLHPTHDAAYWAAATRGMDFSVEDRVDPLQFNHVLWKGLMGDKSYPSESGGADLRANRAELLEKVRENTR